MFEPRHLQVSADGSVEVDWKDGHRSVLPARLLRGNCGCAQCVDEMTHRRHFTERDADTALRVEDTLAVGRYAIGILFSDLHATGIYPFTRLRTLCPCPECQALRAVQAT